MQGSQRENAEAVLNGVLGSMYTGEWLYSAVNCKVFLKLPHAKPVRIRCEFMQVA